MIHLIQHGTYQLIETKRHTKILHLDNKKKFAWVVAGTIGEILVTSHKKFQTDHILSLGKYRLYDIKDEADLTDLIHLELMVGNGVWQGYLLPSGLPTDKKKRNRIIPTQETITKSAPIGHHDLIFSTYVL
ncbi:MAG: hypothetical protein HZC02_02605 [Candidatus Levybacteria bacterium]|nr:hypothetical protein [Candidatus Levybacteria bacterium]